MRKRKKEPVGKRLLSFVMALAMVLTTVVAMPATAAAAEGQVNITLHYYNEYGWTIPALQYWGGESTEVTGAAQTNQEISGGGWCCRTISDTGRRN